MLLALRRALIATSLLLLAGSAAAQDETLNNTWFKLKFKVKGEAAVPGQEKPHKGSDTVTAYLHLTLVPPIDSPADGVPTYPMTQYAYDLYTESTPGSWTITDGGENGLETADPTVFYLPSILFSIHGQDGAIYATHQTIVIKAKLDDENALKSATLKSLGGQVFEGTTDGDDAVRGGVVTTGKTVAVEDLPFELG